MMRWKQQQGGDGTEAPAKKHVKGSYVSIYSSGFQDFLLKPELLWAIVDCGFEHPSEVQRGHDVQCYLEQKDPSSVLQVHARPNGDLRDDETKLMLHGLQQCYVKPKDSKKNQKLFDLLEVLDFNQVVIFVKSVQHCIALAQLLVEQNLPAIITHSGMPQEERVSGYQQFKDF
ncbi:hypothetical protein HJG60_008275 [Phyllostomus discolor]|uniref:RNA helicase n=1 Tax=Phyllostomus discolor TaxID=89673 RepID=A0A834DM08_9CHIR|nr:hypothetical protein HJG60_008275 [Phyllostomus discolor]